MTPSTTNSVCYQRGVSRVAARTRRPTRWRRHAVKFRRPNPLGFQDPILRIDVEIGILG